MFIGFRSVVVALRRAQRSSILLDASHDLGVNGCPVGVGTPFWVVLKEKPKDNPPCFFSWSHPNQGICPTVIPFHSPTLGSEIEREPV